MFGSVLTSGSSLECGVPNSTVYVMCSEYSGPWACVCFPLPTFRLPCPLTTGTRLVQPVRRHLGAVCVARPVSCDWTLLHCPLGSVSRKSSHKAAPNWPLPCSASFTHCCDCYAFTYCNPWERGQIFPASGFPSTFILVLEAIYSYICFPFTHLYIKLLLSVMWQVLFF